MQQSTLPWSLAIWPAMTLAAAPARAELTAEQLAKLAQTRWAT
jgi:hypothetical protein